MYIAEAGPFVTFGLVSGESALTALKRYCPFEVEAPIIIADPGALECRDALRALVSAAHVRGSWYQRFALEPLLAAIRSAPAPARAPGIPDIPQRLTDVYLHGSRYQSRLAVAESVAYVRGLTDEP